MALFSIYIHFLSSRYWDRVSVAKDCQMILIGHYHKAINVQIQIFTMFTYLEGIMFRGNTYMSNFIYIYIFGGWQGCGERCAGLSELMFLNFIFKQPVKRLVKFPLEALIKDMAEEGKPYISW